VYTDFLARIEPSEWPFHLDDVPTWPARAAELAGA
jgi:hypothetical protein